MTMISKLLLITKKLFRYIHFRLLFDPRFGRYKSLDDETFTQKKYSFLMGKELDLVYPATFNEKIQWLKLYDRNPIYTTMVDKRLAKDYAAGIIGKKYIIPTIGVWEKAEEIDFAALPNKFVLKCNHNSGTGMYICKDKTDLSDNDIAKIRANLRKGLRENYYLAHREWPYKNVNRRILAEEFIETESGDLPDYKFFCFNGKAKLILVCKNRFSKEGVTEDFFDEEWNRLPLKRPNIPTSSAEIDRPEKLQEMISLAEMLAADIPFLRADFYYANNRIYFGEMTFYPNSGFKMFEPEKWDRILGSYLELPETVKVNKSNGNK